MNIDEERDLDRMLAVDRLMEGGVIMHSALAQVRAPGKQGPHSHSNTHHCWPEAAYYVSESLEAVYCPIPKVACSSLKLWWAEIHGADASSFRGAVGIDHALLNLQFALRHRAPGLNCSPLAEDGWFRWAFVRNPWARLVSAFANKFVKSTRLPAAKLLEIHRVRCSRRSWAHRLREALLPRWMSEDAAGTSPPTENRSASDQDFTFRKFLETLSTLDLQEGNPQEVDVHWMPQYRFLGRTEFDFLGRFEQLAEGMATVADRLGIAKTVPEVNRTNFATKRESREVFADWPVARLRDREMLPDYRQFYTSALVRVVGKLYERDITQFGYDF